MINIYLWLNVAQERFVGLLILSRETDIVEKLGVKQLICTIFRPKVGKLSFTGVLIFSMHYILILIIILDF
jgi:hypothetical protein